MSAVSPAPVLAVAGSFSIDSILAPDGHPVVGKVGGNALWSSLGALICGLAPRVLAIVGNDYPAHVLDILTNAGLDTRSIRKIDRPHPVRVTFAHLPDGSRIQPVPDHMIQQLPEDVQAAFVDTTSRPDILPLGAPTAKDVPAEWLAEADFWHLPLLPLHRHREMVAHLGGASGYLQSDCPARSDLIENPFAKLSETLGALDVFLPSTSDFDVIAPLAEIPEILQRLTDIGARTIVLKAGADGVFVKDGDALWRVPAYPGSPVDPTGAGDTFCGGFLAGMALTGDLVEAATLGSAAASFAVATADPLDLVAIAPEQTRERAKQLRAAAERLDGSALSLSAVPAGTAALSNTTANT